MATVAQVINAALKKIIVAGSEAPLEADEYQDAIFALNNLVTDWDANGIALGYTVVSNLSDTVTVPTGALRGLIANLAIACAPEYDGVVSPELIEEARSGMNTIRMIGQSIPTSYYPSTLPLGSGNNNLQFGLTSFYYPDQEAEILGETTGSIGLEVDTETSDDSE
jgi:hypothetical protein